ncbi:hypothetical protein JHK85_013009 [Glycine max]|nr:hypothetical protein JHK85_013009 [Glycine max]KAG5057680.1 hypothetical protein JHK86_012676 [Glycine max]
MSLKQAESHFIDKQGESIISKSSLDSFPIPSVKSGEDLLDDLETKEKRDKCCEVYSGHLVYELNEVVAAKHRRFQGPATLGNCPGSGPNSFGKKKGNRNKRSKASSPQQHCRNLKASAIDTYWFFSDYRLPLFFG